MKKIFAFVLYYLFWFEIRRRKKNDNVILSIYGHDPRRGSVDKSLGWLVKNGYKFITPQQLNEYISGKPIDGKLAFLSFDDGWKSNYYELLPVLEKYKIPATIFISTKGIEEGYYWFNHLREHRNSKLICKIDELWQIPNNKRIEIVQQLPKYEGERTALNTYELKKLSDSELIFVGNHTHDHVLCDNCTKQQLIQEIVLFENKIFSFLGKQYYKIFAYPNGNYDKKTIEVLKRAGYKLGFTTKIGFIDFNTNAFEIPRNALPDKGSLKESILQVFGLWSPFFNRIKKIMHIKNRK